MPKTLIDTNNLSDVANAGTARTNLGAAPATSGSSLLQGNGSGGFTNVTTASTLSLNSGTLGVNSINVRRLEYRALGGSSSTLTGNGFSSSNSGITARANQTTNYLSRFVRAGLVGTTAADNQIFVRGGNRPLWVGDGTGQGGYSVKLSFGMPVFQTGMRLMAGLYDNITGQFTATSDPSAVTNALFFGFDAADTEFQLMYNDGAGTCTKVATGIAIDTAAVYEAYFSTGTNGGANYTISLTNKRTGASYSTTLSTNATNTPSTTTNLTWHLAAANVATGVAAQLDFLQVEAETY